MGTRIQRQDTQGDAMTWSRRHGLVPAPPTDVCLPRLQLTAEFFVRGVARILCPYRTMAAPRGLCPFQKQMQLFLDGYHQFHLLRLAIAEPQLLVLLQFGTQVA